MRKSTVFLITVLHITTVSCYQSDFTEDDLPHIMRELEERSLRIEEFSKNTVKRMNMAARENELLQSSIPRPPIDNSMNSLLEPIDNHLPDFTTKTTVPSRPIDTGMIDYESAESAIVSPPKDSTDDKRFMLSEKFFVTSESPMKARAAPTLPSKPIIFPLTTNTEPPTTTVTTTRSSTITTTPSSTTVTTTPSSTTLSTTPRRTTVTFPKLVLTQRTVRSLIPLSFPPLPKFLPKRFEPPMLPPRHPYSLCDLC